MFAEERHQEIVRRARDAGRVDVATLAEELDVTAETVRRDLTALERAGLLRRVHGGAVAIERFGFEPAVAARETVLTAEKGRIGKAALSELPDDGAVVIDAGTTTRQFIELLPTDIELTVVVNSPPTATVPARPSARGPPGAEHAPRRRRLHGHHRDHRRARPDHARSRRGGGQAGHDD